MRTYAVFFSQNYYKIPVSVTGRSNGTPFPSRWACRTHKKCRGFQESVFDHEIMWSHGFAWGSHRRSPDFMDAGGKNGTTRGAPGPPQWETPALAAAVVIAVVGIVVAVIVGIKAALRQRQNSFYSQAVGRAGAMGRRKTRDSFFGADNPRAATHGQHKPDEIITPRDAARYQVRHKSLSKVFTAGVM